MQTSMTLSGVAALFGVLLVLALIPSISALAVSARAAAYGFKQGAYTTLGIVSGDIIFILIALFGLNVLAQGMGSLFVLVKYLGAVYLVVLGVVLWRSASKPVRVGEVAAVSSGSSFLTGLLITLGDQKAILFYLGVFPAFLDLSAVSYADTSIIISVATIAVGGSKLVYACFAARTGYIFKNPRASGMIRRVAGVAIAFIGIYLVAREGWAF